MDDFRRPFKAVPLKPKRLKGLDEFELPVSKSPQRGIAIDWGVAAIGVFIGLCLGMVYVLSGQ